MTPITQPQLSHLIAGYNNLVRKLADSKLAAINDDQEFVVMTAEHILDEMYLIRETLLEIIMEADLSIQVEEYE
jgi:hypothetical protein